MPKKLFEAYGEWKSIPEWARWGQAHLRPSITEDGIRNRIYNGMTMQDALETVSIHEIKEAERAKEAARIKNENAKIRENNAIQLITKRMVDRSPYKDTVTFYGGNVFDFLPKGGEHYDVVVLYRRSSSCVSWETVKDVDAVRIAEMDRRKDILRVQKIREVRKLK